MSDDKVQRPVDGEPLTPKDRDYVLATKYADGDPGDPWAVGFYAGQMLDGRHQVVGDKGAGIYASGYRRVGRIPAAIGNWLMANAALLENAPSKINLWGMYDWTFVNATMTETQRSSSGARSDETTETGEVGVPAEPALTAIRQCIEFAENGSMRGKPAGWHAAMIQAAKAEVAALAHRSAPEP